MALILTENYRLDPYSLRKLQLAELECLKELKRICEKNNIPYFLIGGTLIGAVRHKGFIPWDDDVDVGMLRSDYDKFCKICASEINSEKFFFQTAETEENCADYEIARIRLNNTHIVQRHRKNLKLHDGVFLEIIPYDDLPDDDRKAKKYSEYFKETKKFLGMRMGYNYAVSKKEIKEGFYKRFKRNKMHSLEKLHKKMINYHTKYMNTNSEKVFLLAGDYSYDKETHLRSSVTNLSTLEFEGEQYPVPADWDNFLSEQYGGYMNPPPEDKRYNKCFIVTLDLGPYDVEVKELPVATFPEYPTKKIQKCLLVIVKEIKRICEKNDIKYFMLAGTLLGAVRHKGFIPWDDDIDLGMLRSEYNRFIEACKKDLDHEKFFIQTIDTDPEYGKFYMRVLLNGTSLNYPYIRRSNCRKSIFVDVFPYDSIPENKYLQKLQCMQTNGAMRLIKKKVGFNSNGRTIGAKIEYMVEPWITKNALVNFYEKNMQRYNKKTNSKYICCSNAGYGYFREIMKRQWITETVPMQFEDIELPGSKMYDEYLTHLFKDYMVLPAKSKQVTHSFEKIDFGPYDNL